MKTGGSLVYFKSFGQKWVIDEYLVSGFLSAIKSIGQMAFAKGEEINSIRFKEHIIFFLSIEEIFFCFIVNTDLSIAPSLLKKFLFLVRRNESVWQGVLQTDVRQTDNEMSKLLDSYTTEVFDK
jgi:hypothetical protein